MSPDLSQLDAVATFSENHRTVVIATAGVVMVSLAALGRWARKRLQGTTDLFGRLCDTTAVAIAIALSAEGMWEVATESLEFDPVRALLLFAFAELAMLRSARRARAKVARGRRPGVYGVMVWTIALAAGIITATNAPNLPELLVRLVAPTLVAAQWWADLIDQLRELHGTHQESRWIWTPQRVGIHLGLIKPGTGDDLDVVYRQRRVDRMVRLAGRIDTGWDWLSGRRKLRLRRLAERADAQMLTEVRERYQRGATAGDHIFARTVPRPSTTSAQPDRVPAAQESRTPVANGSPQAARPVAQVDAAPARRGQVVMRRPAEATVDEREAAMDRAIAQVLTQKASVRGAAREAGVPESTLRTRLKSNGHSFEPAGR